MKTGIELLSQERQKQIDKHGFTAEHHAKNPKWYDGLQLQYAAMTLLMHELQEGVDAESETPINWDVEWFVDLNSRSRKERLVIAGALIAAELDRLNQLEIEESKPMPFEKEWPASSTVTKAKYLPNESKIEINFKNGTVHHFEDVPVEIWKEMLVADSAGSFFNKRINPNYKGYRFN